MKFMFINIKNKKIKDFFPTEKNKITNLPIKKREIAKDLNTHLNTLECPTLQLMMVYSRANTVLDCAHG